MLLKYATLLGNAGCDLLQTYLNDSCYSDSSPGSLVLL